jgi:hypothetical protein
MTSLSMLEEQAIVQGEGPWLADVKQLVSDAAQQT